MSMQVGPPTVLGRGLNGAEELPKRKSCAGRRSLGTPKSVRRKSVSAMARSNPRTIRISDVVKALEIAAERLGDAERSCKTLRLWASRGRVTPAGQVLTPEAVDAGIEAWLATKEKERTNEARSAVAAAAAAVAETEKKSAGEPIDAVNKLAVADEPTVVDSGNKREFGADVKTFEAKSNGKGKRGRKPAPGKENGCVQKGENAQDKLKEVGKAEANEISSKPPLKKSKTKCVSEEQLQEAIPSIPTHEERKEERLKSAAHMRELANTRLLQVMEEIGDHMQDIVRRTSPEALERWRNASNATDSEKRELYTRLVHAVTEVDVRQPEELTAELLPHQVEGLEWLVSLYTNGLHGILADEMGLGKTIQTISLLLHILERKGNRGPHLIVAPKSCLSNWEQEFQKFAPHFTVKVLTGCAEDRDAGVARLMQAYAEGKPVACVTNYEQVYRNESLMKKDWQLVVVDEGHRLKNPETVLHSAMKQLRCRMRLLLTGTPLQNGLNELWALLHYLLPELFTHLMDFKSWFSRPFRGMPGINEFDIQLDPEQEQRVIARMHGLLSPFLLQRLKCDVLADKLPPRVEVSVRVPLSAWQSAAYTDLEKRTIRLLGDNESVASEQINNALMQLRKISLHPFLFQESYGKDPALFRTSGKMEILDRLLEKLIRFEHKVLIFSQFTTMLDILEDLLEWRGTEYVRLDGQVQHQERARRIDRFSADPKVPVFLLSARAGSLGLNLQAADTVVLFDMDWNPQNDKQAVARVHRVGQTKEVRVIRLLSDSAVERHMEQRCQEKLDMEQKIMGAGMFRRQVTADQRKQALRAVLGISITDGQVEPAEKSDSALEEVDWTTLEEVNSQLARTPAEESAFAEIDNKYFGPASMREGLNYKELLVTHRRLMTESEVPAGFTGGRSEED